MVFVTVLFFMLNVWFFVCDFIYVIVFCFFFVLLLFSYFVLLN